MNLPVMPPVRPMLGKAIDELPTAPGTMYEPKWDGFRCIVFRDGDEVELGSRNERPMTRYFPELVDALRRELPERCVVDGEVVVVGENGLSFDSLQQRIHPAESRVRRLAAETPASFVGFDLLALGDRDLRDTAFAERRRLLESALGGARPPVYLTPITTDRDVAADWFVRFEGAGLDGVVAKDPKLRYLADQRVMGKVKHRRTADCVVAGFRFHKSGDGAGSLLLGLYDEGGDLHHVGVAASFAAKQRRQLLEEIAPLREGAVENHPWREWADAMAQAMSSGRMPGGLNRWNAKKDMSWEPLRIERVAEVGFEQLQQGRFRHTARFMRWRPDKDPAQCTFDQLDVAVPYELELVFGAGTPNSTQ